jgi:hypothetical protein
MEHFIRIRPARLDWPSAIGSSTELRPDIERLRLVDNFKGYDQLKRLPKLKALWCFGIDDAALSHIADCEQLEELHMDYRLKTGKLRALKNLSGLRILTINTCSHISSLDEISEFEELEGLHIENLKNVHSIDKLSKLRKLKQLGVAGSIWTRMKIETLAPLSNLTSLEYLDLTNLKAKDESLKPLAQLNHLRELDLPNFYAMKEIAWLSGRLTNTHCTWFAPYIRMNLECEKCKAPTRVMLSGKGKPILCRNCDALRLGRHVEEFERISMFDTL